MAYKYDGKYPLHHPHRRRYRPTHPHGASGSGGYDNDGATDSLEIITTGKITNIASSADAYTKNNKTQPGYTLATLTGLRNAGYTEYIWKTVLIHSLIALVISGFLGFMFFKTWNVDFKEDSKVTNKNIKNKKNKTKTH